MDHPTKQAHQVEVGDILVSRTYGEEKVIGKSRDGNSIQITTDRGIAVVPEATWLPYKEA